MKEGYVPLVYSSDVVV